MDTKTMLPVIEASPYARFWHTGQTDIPLKTLTAWARAQRLLPLIGWRVEHEGWTLPEGLQEAVAEARYRQAAKQMLVERQLRSLVALMRETSLDVTVVKGPVVAEAYPSPELRPYGDIDLFVSEAETLVLANLLEHSGYHAKIIGDRSTHLPPMEPADPGLRVEVHGLPYAHFDFAPLQRWTAYPGLWRPDPVAHFVYLVHHAVERHELHSGLLHLIDLKFWTAAWTLDDWQRAYDLAEAMGHLRMVGLALALLPLAWPGDAPALPHDLFPTPPEKTLAAGARAVFGHEPGLLPHLGRDLHERTLRGWLRYARLVLFGDPRVRRGCPWQEQLGFYLRRPFRLLKNYGPLFLRLLRGDQASQEALQRQRDLMAWVRGES
jgi:hypothetical protein